MKTLFAVLLMLFALTQQITAQSNNENVKNTPVSALTEMMIKKYYSVEQQNELSKNPIKLKSLDYIYSKSFEIVSGQEYTNTQFEKIDIVKFDRQRKVNENVIVFDETSGLKLLLYSLNAVEDEKSKIDPSYISLKKRQSKSTN